MPAITVYGLEIPEQAATLAGFRDWVARLGEAAPRVHFSRGRIHVEMTPQDYETHAPLVRAIARTLDRIAEDSDLGRFYVSPSWVTVEGAGLSTEPDGFLVRWTSFESGRVRLNPHRKVEMLGAPDMVLEVVSRTSEKKDTQELVEDYARAGVEEYWIADGRGDAPSLRILVLDDGGRYVEQSPDEGGWLLSPTWNAGFRLEGFVDRAGLPDYRLEERA